MPFFSLPLTQAGAYFTVSNQWNCRLASLVRLVISGYTSVMPCGLFATATGVIPE